MNKDPDIKAAAEELISRLGHGAIQYTKERIEQMRKTTKPTDLDQQIRLLTEVERLLEEET